LESIERFGAVDFSGRGNLTFNGGKRRGEGIDRVLPESIKKQTKLIQ